jgi:putative DNA primase/helicase
VADFGIGHPRNRKQQHLFLYVEMNMIVADRAEVRNQENLVNGQIDQLSDTQLETADDRLPTTSQLEILDRIEAPSPFQGLDFQPPEPDIVNGPAPLRTLDDSWQEPLIRKVAEWLRALVGEGQVVELRALNVATPSGATLTYSGFYDYERLDKMAEAALYWSPEAEGVYFTLNPLDQSLLARRYNKVCQAKDTAADADVIQRRLLLIDADPVRKAGISATEGEKGSAWQTVGKVYRWLRDRGWAEPILADSGNGYHLIYRIDLPCDDGGLVKSVLKALAGNFDSKQVKIDTNVFNPSRIAKLYGTVARKGESLRERPHRRTGVLSVPRELLVVSREQLEAVGGMELPRPVQQTNNRPTVRNTLLVGDRNERLERARNYLMKVSPAVSGEKGHNRTFKAACILTVRFGLSEEEALPILQEWNETCQPPWPEKDLRKKLRDAASRAAQGNGALPTVGRNEVIGTDGAALDAVAFPEAREAPDDPHRLAQVFLQGGVRQEGQITIRCWNGDWYQWDGQAYRLVSEGEVRAELTRSIKQEFDRLNVLERLQPVVPAVEDQLIRERSVRKVTTRLVTDVLQALRSKTLVPAKVEPPAWLNGDGLFPAAELVAAKNGIIHLPSLMDGKDCVRPATPNLFTTVALDYEVSREASKPASWLSFLEALWPGDADSVALLQEWFGYCLTQDTSQQKMLLVVGPKRAGKGTIARVLSALVGNANVAGPTLGSLAANFGLSQLLGKPVAIISDARFSGRSAEQAMVVERLLSISGEDTLTIDRKNRQHLTVKLPTRFTILTNELPRLTDASAALPSRLLVLQLTRSWYGKEDMQLVQKLLQERSGIFLWAVEGLKRLRARGRFVQPESGVETATRLVELSSSVTAFVQDRCELGQGKTIAKGTLFFLWREWCNECGHEPGSAATFGRNLMAAFPEIQSSRPREGSSRVNSYTGIGRNRL